VGGFGRIPDWASHGAAYLVLSLLLCRALTGGLRRPLRTSAALAAVALATAYGVGDELHQSTVPGRDASRGDVLKDLGGAAAGALLYRRCFGGSDE
jgi:VanZ family protein